MKPNKLPPTLAALALLLAPVPAIAQPAPPPPAADAEVGHDSFQLGVQLFREGNFRSALVQFRRSYEVSKNFKVLFNIGQTEYELQDYAGALRSFQRYLEAGGAQIEAGRRAQVEEEIRKLGARVARIEIKSNAEGAEVLVDDVVVGTTPLAEAVLVSIGRRKLTLQKGGVVSAARFVDVASGDKTSVTLELAEARATPPAPTPIIPPPEAAPAPSRTGMWVSLAITGGLLAATGVFGGLAISSHGDTQKTLGTLGVKASDVSAAHSKTRTLALVADILGGTTLAMAGVTIVLGVTSGKSEPPKAATLTFHPRGLALGGSF